SRCSASGRGDTFPGTPPRTHHIRPRPIHNTRATRDGRQHMAKTRVKKTAPGGTDTAGRPKTGEPLSPEKVHALFGIAGPYDPPPAPPELAGYATFWDPGISI